MVKYAINMRKYAIMHKSYLQIVAVSQIKKIIDLMLYKRCS